MKDEKTLQVILRKSTPLDAPKILNLFKKSHAVDMIGYPDVDDNDAILWIMHTIATGVSVVACVGDRIVASFGGVLSRYGWNMKKPYLKSEWFCFLNKYTDTGAPLALLKKVKQDANINKCDIVFSNYGDTFDTIQLKLLESGMKSTGGTMVWIAKPDSEVATWISE